MTFHRLQTRILALFVVLMAVVQLGSFLLINTVGVSAARKTIGAELARGERVFARLREQDSERLVQSARLLSADYAFREAVATGGGDKITAMMWSHGMRVDADIMMLVGLDGRVVADIDGDHRGKAFPYPQIFAEAVRAQRASAVTVVRGRLHEIVIVPVLAPVPVAWVAIGFNIDDAVVKDLGRLTGLDVSFASRNGDDDWRLQASTLALPERQSLMLDFAANRFAVVDDEGNAESSGGSLTRVLPVSAASAHRVVALLQQPIDAALEPFRHLQRQLLFVSLVAVVVSILASLLIARGIARPVGELANVARRIAGGDYSTRPAVSRNDEIGDLAKAFRTMQNGIASRETRIMELAYRDTLTGLPNRAKFNDRLESALATAAAQSAPVGVLLMDLDHFKYVNDTLGHSDRRPAAARGRRTAARGRHGRQRHRRAAGRRRVRHAAARQQRGRRAPRRARDPAGTRSADELRGPRSSTCARASASRRSRTTGSSARR